MKRRLLSIFLSLTMILSMVPSVWAADETKQDDTDDTAAQETKTPAESKMNGDCGATEADDVTWKLEQNNTDSDSEKPTYTLTISGSGNMADFTQPTDPTAVGASIAPWYTALADSADGESNTVPITEVVVRDGVTGLGNWAFAYTQVTKAAFTKSVKNYGIQLYSHCTELTTVDWTNFAPEKVMLNKDDTEPYEGAAIPGNLFDTDRKLHICIVSDTTYTDTLVVPDNVAAVGTSGFYGTAFTEVNFKTGLKGVQQVGIYSFANMLKLETLYVPAGLTYVLSASSSNAFAEEAALKSLTLEDGITEIPTRAFRDNPAIETLVLPSTITSIGEWAFNNNNSLYAVDLTRLPTN